MNYKLDNPVAYEVIDIMSRRYSHAVKRVVECSKKFDYNLCDALSFCIRHRLINNEAGFYIFKTYKREFKRIIKERNQKLSIRNVMR